VPGSRHAIAASAQTIPHEGDPGRRKVIGHRAPGRVGESGAAIALSECEADDVGAGGVTVKRLQQSHRSDATRRARRGT